MKLIGRLAVRLGASAMVAAAGLAVAATPASAAPGVDLAVTVSSGVVASGSAGKPFTVKVTNLGDSKPEGFDLVIDLAKIDGTKVTVTVPSDLSTFCAPASGSKIACEFGNVLVRNDSLEVPVVVTPVSGGATGSAGSFAVAATTAGDTNAANNNATVPVSVSKAGVDIVVWAEDVTAGRDDETGEAKRLAPGATGAVSFGIANAGSVGADGFELVFQLPQHVSVVGTLAGCTVSGSKVTCTLEDVLLDADRYLEAELPVKLSADAPQSVELKGTLQGRSLGVAEGPSADASRSARTAPSWLKVAAGEFDANEVDNKDNSDDFVVFVGTTGGGGGGLPVTGPKAIMIGGVGAAVLAVGVFLFMGARRRRVVLVTPAE